jgi:hypothetical protein
MAVLEVEVKIEVEAEVEGLASAVGKQVTTQILVKTNQYADK